MEYTAKTLNSARGDYGENKAKQYLLSQGYRIKQLKYKNVIGEIDIIAMDGNILVFIEVKYRNTAKYGLPREAVNYYKQQKIRKIASLYLTKQNLYEKVPIRFDVIDILGEKVTHIKNAF